MTTRLARLTIFSCWFGTLFICIAIAFSGVPIQGLDWHEVFRLTKPILALYVPVLTAFAIFWFHQGAPATRRRIGRDKWLPALLLTLFFQVLMVTALLGIIHFSPRPGPSAVVGFFELVMMQVSELVEWISILSPIATAPTAFLLGVEQIKVE